MSQYTKLVLVADAAWWVPSREFLVSVFSFLEVSKVDHLTGYKSPRYWDRPCERDFDIIGEADNVVMLESHNRDVLYSYADIAVAKSVDAWMTEPAACTHFLLNFGAWARRLVDSLDWIPKELAASYPGPWDVSILVGPSSIPDRDFETTIAQTNCQLGMGAQGCPANLDEYFAILKNHPQIHELNALLERESGVSWSMHFLVW